MFMDLYVYFKPYRRGNINLAQFPLTPLKIYFCIKFQSYATLRETQILSRKSCSAESIPDHKGGVH